MMFKAKYLMEKREKAAKEGKEVGSNF